MRNHYVPQYYLRGFCPDLDRTIWVYDIQESRKFSTRIKKIANIHGFYPPELEKYLSEDVEGPANRVLEKIRNRVHLTPTEKITFAGYITVMWKRVPMGKGRFGDQAPGIAAKLRETLHRELSEAVKKDSSVERLARRRKAEIDEILDKYSRQPPEDVWHQVIRAEHTPRMIAAVATMTWQFFTFDEEPAFLTSDNPVFFFPELGVGRSESELSFPVSSNMTLWATRRTDLVEGYFPVTMSIVKEMNRRTASFSARYVFHAEDEDWILPFLSKKKWRLNFIQ